MNKPKYAITSFAIFQVSEIGLTTFLTQLVSILRATGFYFKSKVIEGSHKGENNVFEFSDIFS